MKTMPWAANAPSRSRALATAAVALGILLTALLTKDALGQEATARGTTDRAPFALVGTLADPSGAPLVGAFVSLTDSDWGSLTNEAGRFRLPNVTPATVSLSAELIGYETLVWTGTVAADEALASLLAARVG